MENDFLMIDRIKLYLKEYSVLKSGYTLLDDNNTSKDIIGKLEDYKKI